ncbi:spo11/DNA topoisomerase VI subunit A, Heavy metal-associated domain, HMA [Artemisia annua]|uniref:Spo11/DNA topoisomerase VI subunit A, Heavy metal-associated domain, HMA n=1 Tax=Artemisia annua TaxID=35608 RepID=A0A2U1QC07_ARTAN|nr:spo11/DNA topoisomerase VI subunit A, Heavy metal-associated domain, HMA [Artemisia annua]
MAIAYADMECLLRVDTKCPSCVQKTLRVLSSVVGVYEVSMDAEKKLFRISGEVDPNILVKQLFDAGKHAELVSFKAKHPHLRYQNYNSHASSSSYGGGYVPYHRDGYNYGSYGGGYNLLPEHPYGMQRMAPPQIEYPSSYNNTYGYQNPLPLATNVPSYPYQERDPYGNYYDGMNGCCIM